jgi:hypothetical protein
MVAMNECAFRSDGTCYVFSIHMDVCLWDVAHFHDCRFARALLRRARACVCVHMCLLFIFATYLNIVRPTTRGDMFNSATMVIPCNYGLRETSGYCVYSLGWRHEWSKAHR